LELLASNKIQHLLGSHKPNLLVECEKSHHFAIDEPIIKLRVVLDIHSGKADKNELSERGLVDFAGRTVHINRCYPTLCFFAV